MNFDEVIDRKNTWSLKWDNPKDRPGLKDIIPLWVADMDLSSPEGVLDAIKARAEHPIFGYTNAPREYFEAVSAWYAERHGIEVCPANIVLAPGMIPSIAASLRALTKPGDGIVVFTPVYFPFFSIASDNDRVPIPVPLRAAPDGRWSLDHDAMESAVSRAESEGVRARAILLCSPHNPVGRVWTCKELSEIDEFAQSRRMAVVSDEIHCDIVFPPNKFKSYACAEGKRASEVVVLGGPNKTFNLAGLHISHAIIRDGETRNAFKKAMAAWGFSQPNVFSLVAALAAYRTAAAWLDEALQYIKGNYSLLLDFLSSRLPSAKASPLEGSYLALLDVASVVRSCGFADDRALAEYLEESGRVKFSAGGTFGKGGENHLRVNLACPKRILLEGLERAADAIAKRGAQAYLGGSSKSQVLK